MTEEALKINGKKKRERSVLYPSATIEECLEFISILKKLGGRDIVEEDVLREMGIAA